VVQLSLAALFHDRCRTAISAFALSGTTESASAPFLRIAMKIVAVLLGLIVYIAGAASDAKVMPGDLIALSIAGSFQGERK
jgi:hypothetical protein